MLRLALDLQRHIEAVSARFELSPAQARVILLLTEPMRMHSLAETMTCEPSHATGLASALEQRGLVTREVDESDRRARRVSLTDAGVALRGDLVPALLDHAPVIAGLSEKELRALIALVGADRGAASGQVGDHAAA